MSSTDTEVVVQPPEDRQPADNTASDRELMYDECCRSGNAVIHGEHDPRLPHYD